MIGQPTSLESADSGLSTRLKGLASFGLRRLAVPRVRAVCSIPSCESSIVLRPAAAPGRTVGGSIASLLRGTVRQAGIHVGADWYCSSPCFRLALEVRLLDLVFEQRRNAPGGVRMPLNLQLIAAGSLTHAQSLHAAEERKRTAEKWEDVLVRLGYVNTRNIAAARGRQAGCPVYSERGGPVIGPRSKTAASDSVDLALEPKSLAPPSSISVAEPLIGIQLPPRLLERHGVVPLHYVPATRRLLLGFVHDIDRPLLRSIERMTGSKAEPCFLAPEDFDLHLNRIRDQAARDRTCPESKASRNSQRCVEVAIDAPEGPAQMARTVSGYAVQFQADEARLECTRDYIWVRLESVHRRLDMLFPQPRFAQLENRRSAQARPPATHPTDRKTEVTLGRADLVQAPGQSTARASWLA